MFAPGATPEATDEARTQVADDVAVQVREDEDVVQVRLLDELHAHVVDDTVLELDPARVARGNRLARLEEQPVGQLHDVGLVHGGDLSPAVGDRVLEGEAGDPLRRGASDDLDALGGVLADHVLDARVQVLGVLPNDHQVDVVVPALDPDHRPCGAQVRVQVQRLAQPDVDAAEAGPDGGRDRALERDLVPPDRLEDALRERRPLGRDRGLAGLLDLPLELDPGRIEHAPCRLRQFRADPVAGDESDAMGHARILGAAP